MPQRKIPKLSFLGNVVDNFRENCTARCHRHPGTVGVMLWEHAFGTSLWLIMFLYPRRRPSLQAPQRNGWRAIGWLCVTQSTNGWFSDPHALGDAAYLLSEIMLALYPGKTIRTSFGARLGQLWTRENKAWTKKYGEWRLQSNCGTKRHFFLLCLFMCIREYGRLI